MQPNPLAYHITWATYGSWLPGDERGWVQKGISGVQPADPAKLRNAKGRMKGEPVTLDAAERRIVELAIVELCRERGWALHAVNVRSNHVHLVVSSNLESETTRERIKARCAARLSDHAGLGATTGRNGRKRWFAEKGNEKWIWDDEYLANAIRYVMEQQ